MGIALLLVSQVAAAQSAGAQLVSLTLSGMPSALRQGGTVALAALGTYDDGTSGVDLTSSVNWTSSASSVASVAAGSVTGLALGTTSIVATDPATGIHSRAAEGSIRVVGTLLEISITPRKRILPIGRTTRYRAAGRFEGGVTLDISREVDWITSTAGLVRFDEIGRARGLAPGSATVTAVDRRTGLSSAASGSTGKLTVTGVLTALRVSPSSIAVPPGGSTQMKAWATFEGYCQQYTYTSRIRWTSSDPSIATVDPEGILRCLGEGTAQVSVRDRPTGIASSDSSENATVVCGGSLVAIRVSPQSYVVPLGQERELRAYYVFLDGTVADGTRNVVWSSSDESVIEIGRDGDAGAGIARAPGSATISAFDPLLDLSSSDPGGSDGILDVPGELQALTLSPSHAPGGTLLGLIGSTIRLRTTALYDGGLSRAVDKLARWESSDPEIVGLHDGSKCYVPGTARLLDLGDATVSATYGLPGAQEQTASVDIRVVSSIGSASRAFLAAPASLLD